MPLAPALAPAQTVAHNNRAASLYDQALHRRGSSSPERWPVARLLDVNGTLYGTDSFGGKYGWGTVFSISTTGAVQVLHSFGSGSDGTVPDAGLIDVKGTLYGTTSGGGQYNDGTVFSISTAGTEHVLYSFAGEPDGPAPLPLCTASRKRGRIALGA